MSEDMLKTITFMGRDFFIDRTVHFPRPSTEFISKQGYVEYAQRTGIDNLVVADIGVGSGVTAISWALECDAIGRVYGVDLYEAALTMARKNATQLMVGDKVALLQGDLFAPLLETPVDVIVANLPCASDAQIAYMQQNAKMKDEPLATIYGGKTGFELYERLFEQLREYVYIDGVVGIWMLGCTSHMERMKHYRDTQFPDFKLLTFKDKYKPYFLHGLLTKIDFSPGSELVPYE